MRIEKGFIRRTTPDRELEKKVRQMVKKYALDEMIDDSFSDSVKRSLKRSTRSRLFIRMAPLWLAAILIIIFVIILYDISPDSKQTTPPTIEQKSTQEKPDVLKKL